MVKRTSFNYENSAKVIGDSPTGGDPDPATSKKCGNGNIGVDAGSIVIVERRALIRDCLRRCFETACHANVIAVRDIDQWLELSKTASASLIILSVVGTARSPDAQRDIARLTRGDVKWPMIVLSDGDDLEEIVSILDNGARGYIPTDLSFDIAVEALRLVRAGGVFVPASSLVAAKRLGENGAAPPRSNAGIFTVRQAAVVDALRRGKANKVIAYELKMRESTVKVHVRNIMKKLNAKNRTEVAFMANELLRASDGPDAVAAR